MKRKTMQIFSLLFFMIAVGMVVYAAMPIYDILPRYEKEQFIWLWLMALGLSIMFFVGQIPLDSDS